MPLPLWVLLLPVDPSGFAVHVSSLSVGRRIDPERGGTLNACDGDVENDRATILQ
jgi:hypothetical protein